MVNIYERRENLHMKKTAKKGRIIMTLVLHRCIVPRIVRIESHDDGDAITKSPHQVVRKEKRINIDHQKMPY